MQQGDELSRYSGLQHTLSKQHLMHGKKHSNVMSKCNRINPQPEKPDCHDDCEGSVKLTAAYELTKLALRLNNEAVEEKKAKEKRGICNDFFFGGKCHYGELCRYLHEPPEELKDLFALYQPNTFQWFWGGFCPYGCSGSHLHQAWHCDPANLITFRLFGNFPSS